VTASTIEKTELERLTLPAGGHWSRRLEAGERLRIIDLEGRQAVDFLVYNADRPEERYAAADTMKLSGSIYLSAGTKLMSARGYSLMTLVEDSRGGHDTIGGCCSKEFNQLRYGAADTPNCRDNFIAALAPHGLGERDIVANINFFMNVPVDAAGGMAISTGKSVPGDHVELRADVNVIAVISNCPQVNNQRLQPDADRDHRPTEGIAEAIPSRSFSGRARSPVRAIGGPDPDSRDRPRRTWWPRRAPPE